MIRTHIVLTIAVAAGVIASIWRFRPQTWTATQTLGLCVLVVGFVCWSIARFQLGRSFSVTAQAKHLVTHGLYAKIRNPIYVFGSCVFVGAILVIGKPVWLLIFVVIIPLQIQRAKKEAAVLEAAFGEEYRKYRAGTWF
jgi:protein-S-isoprenylcysteine O-methyltransferase Ste14